MKKFKLFLVSALLLAATATVAQTSDVPHHSGDTGPIHYEYNPADSTLTLSGIGAIPDYSSPQTQPWRILHDTVRHINIENGITRIGNYAFMSFTALKDVSLPNTLTTIGTVAFASCDLLRAITIPNSVITIENEAFNYCSSLTEINIPSSVATLGRFTFLNCPSLTAITVTADNPNYSSENGILFNKDKTTLIQYPASRTELTYAVPNSVTTVYDDAFANAIALRDVNIPNSVTTIGAEAFFSCVSLTEVNIPNTIKKIEDFTFIYCASLKEVTIPNSVDSIKMVAFGLCNSLTEVTNYAQTPQPIEGNVFDEVPISLCTLRVPAASVALYQAANVWKDFGTILAIGGTGVDDILAKNINIYPNLVRNELNIESGELRIEKVEIMDLSGKTVPSFNYSENKVNVSTLPSGIYFIKIETDKGVVTEKFVKE